MSRSSDRRKTPAMKILEGQDAQSNSIPLARRPDLSNSIERRRATIGNNVEEAAAALMAVSRTIPESTTKSITEITQELSDVSEGDKESRTFEIPSYGVMGRNPVIKAHVYNNNYGRDIPGCKSISGHNPPNGRERPSYVKWRNVTCGGEWIDGTKDCKYVIWGDEAKNICVCKKDNTKQQPRSNYYLLYILSYHVFESGIYKIESDETKMWAEFSLALVDMESAFQTAKYGKCVVAIPNQELKTKFKVLMRERAKKHSWDLQSAGWESHPNTTPLDRLLAQMYTKFQEIEDKKQMESDLKSLNKAKKLAATNSCIGHEKALLHATPLQMNVNTDDVSFVRGGSKEDILSIARRSKEAAALLQSSKQSDDEEEFDDEESFGADESTNGRTSLEMVGILTERSNRGDSMFSGEDLIPLSELNAVKKSMVVVGKGKKQSTSATPPKVDLSLEAPLSKKQKRARASQSQLSDIDKLTGLITTLIEHETKGNASNYSPNSSPSNEKDLLKLEKSKRKTMKIELRRMETEMKLLKAKEKKRASKKSSLSNCISSPLSAVCTNNGIYNDNGDDFMVDGGYDDDTFGKSNYLVCDNDRPVVSAPRPDEPCPQLSLPDLLAQIEKKRNEPPQLKEGVSVTIVNGKMVLKSSTHNKKHDYDDADEEENKREEYYYDDDDEGYYY